MASGNEAELVKIIHILNCQLCPATAFCKTYLSNRQ